MYITKYTHTLSMYIVCIQCASCMDAKLTKGIYWVYVHYVINTRLAHLRVTGT